MPRSRYIFLIVFTIVSIIMISLFFTYKSDNQAKHFNPEHIYQTWKVKKLYKNGKLVVNNDKFHNLRLKVNRNGTAEWIKNGNSLSIQFKVTPDGSQIIIDDGFTIENIETVFELSKDKFRFGKRNAISHYEYVLIPVVAD